MSFKFQQFKLTLDKWVHAASTALSDHDVPRNFLTKNLNAQVGNNPNDAIVQVKAAEMIEDLKLQTSHSLIYKVDMVKVICLGWRTHCTLFIILACFLDLRFNVKNG